MAGVSSVCRGSRLGVDYLFLSQWFLMRFENVGRINDIGYTIKLASTDVFNLPTVQYVCVLMIHIKHVTVIVVLV